jgi:hypothetical protein
MKGFQAAVRAALALALFVVLEAGVVAPVSAGTTGQLRGRVIDAVTKAPLSGVKVGVASPSQAASTTTDASGAFTFISLSPDTYTVSLDKQGYESSVTAGISVLADQTQNLAFALQRTLRTIGTVRARTTTDVVRPGTTSDVYSINSAKQAAATAVGGPGGVDFAYSGLATVPGLYILQGQQGWQQLISVRGGDPGDVAVELDGVPMFRASDGGTASTLSSLGQQELQAYTGGAPASADANGLSGYINQVMRTGTYPGFLDVTLGSGYPTFYHKASVEFGGATPNRMFTYFFATSGVNQGYRYCGQDMCGGYTNGFFYPLQVTGKSGSVYDGSSPAYFAPGATYALTTTADRETVTNLHAAIPHKHDGLRDDIQFLYVNSEIFSQFYSSINDLGGQSIVNKAIGAPTYTDYNYYTGSVFAPPDPSKVILALFPNSPTDRLPFAPIPPNEREGNSNGVSVIKLQYQKNFNSNSYLRLFGYTNYSNWFISGPVSEFFNYGGQIGDFEITEHAYGAKAIYENQLSSKHLLSANLSYQKQSNQTYSSNIEGTISTNLVDSKGNCYNFSTGNYASCFTPIYFPPANGCSSSSSGSSSSGCTPVLNPAGGLNEYTQFGVPVPGFPSTPKLVPGNPPPGSLAAQNGARWLVTENGAWTDQYDNVSPIWSAVALTDQWHPNDRLTVNAGLRAERYDYDLGNAIDGFPARAFWFSAFNRENCYAQGQPTTTSRTIDPTTGQPSACPAGSNPTNLQNTYPAVATYNSFLPRAGFTYLISPDSVLRGSYGRYADAPSSSDEQVNAYQQNLASSLVEFLPAGFNTPFHNERPALANNADISLEQHLKGTDYAFKLTPFYRTTSAQIESIPIGFEGDVLGLNVGYQKSAGVEFLFSKGDFSRDGLSWQVSYAYTHSTVRYADGPTGTNFIDELNTYVQHFNSFTSACKSGNATLCGTYGSSNAKPTFQNGSSSAPTTVANPYYNDAPQPLLDRNGEYSPYTILMSPYQGAVGYDTPSVLTALANYRKGRFAITPSVTFTSGSFYGSPLVWPGYDPTTCSQTLPGSTKANTQSCSQGSIPLFIPDPYTGHFDEQGSLQEPSRLTGNLQLSYEASKTVKATLVMTSLFDTCFQRGYPWDNPTTCVYGQLPSNHLAPVGNFFPVGAAPVQLRYPYSSWLNNEWVGYVGQRLPFTAFLNLAIKVK